LKQLSHLVPEFEYPRIFLFRRQLALLSIMWKHEQSGQAQFIVATHSPILLGYPGAQILNFDISPLSPIQYEETDHYIITREFLLRRDVMLRELLKPDE
jgi:predicted ATPase